LYDELAVDGHDKGFIPFKIIKKQEIAKGPIVALSLQRDDAGKLHPYQAGQYLTVRIRKDDLYHNRHYSLTEPFDGQTYRIAIKDEIDGDPKGVVSTEIIHHYHEGDIIEANWPAGTFKLNTNAEHHLFLAGGIGITVLSSMIQQLKKQGDIGKATLIQCAASEEHAAFSEQLRAILADNEYHLLFHDQHLDKHLLCKVLRSETHVYPCGSIPFMNAVQDLLEQCGHPSDQIHLEAFQPSLSTIKGAVKNQSITKSL
jgi:nitric oxide dioxygenase